MEPCMDCRPEDNTHDDGCMPVVKNTFITLQTTTPARAVRHSSVPASLRYSFKACRSCLCSDASTDACTEYSYDDEDSGTKTPELSDSEDSFCDSLSVPIVATPRQQFVQNVITSASLLSTKPLTSQRQRLAPIPRLNAKAASFKPQALVEPSTQPNKHHFAKVLKSVTGVLESSELITNVDISHGLQDCTIVVKVDSADDSLRQSVSTLVQQALLDATAQSRYIFLMGYCIANPFTLRPLGFEATLGSMDNANQACWHIFKKGFCRHGANCCKQHPNSKLQVRVLIDTALLDAPHTPVFDFNLQSAEFITTVLATLKQSPYFSQVGASKDKNTKCWTLELYANKDADTYGDYLLTLAKNAFYNASTGSKAVYMLGYAANPFLPVASGFVTVLGNMHAETRSCWDFYSKGMCCKGCDCRWEHPNCMVPVRVIVRSRCD